MSLVVLFLILFASYAISIPTGHTQFKRDGEDDSCTKYYYALFEGEICGVMIFTGMEEGDVTVQTSGKGICGLPSSGYNGPYPYYSIVPSYLFPLDRH